MDTTVDLDTFSSLVERPDESARRAAEEHRQQLDLPPGGLGALEELGAWLASVQGTAPARPVTAAKVLLIAGLGSTPAASTVRRVHAVLDGTAPVAVLARRYGAAVRVVDIAVDADPLEFPEEVSRHRVRRGSGRIDVEDALTADEAARAFRAGMASTDAAAVTGRGSGIDDRVWMVKCATVRDALRRARPVLGDQLALLAATGGADFAAITGFLLQAAVRRLPVVLDGVVSAACALVAQRVAFRAPEWWRAGQDSGEPAQAKAYDRLTLTPLQQIGVRAGGGVGSLLALPLVQAASDALAEPSAVPAAAPVEPPPPARLPSAAELLGLG
jgi:nicotinate-nucleotide--dimethylbenzimidazole phosphoribosyltransferase